MRRGAACWRRCHWKPPEMADDSPCGILNLYKPAGPTSHDCVSRVRRSLGVRRVGHAGTLDPLARGVLVMGVGRAARALDLLQARRKCYLAEAALGLTTDTQDVTGNLLSESDASWLERGGVEALLPGFRGRLMQTPPMASAIKVAGQPLYRMQRRGEEIERAAREIEIHDFELLDFRPGPRPELSLRVVCSSGTYIRTLCHDLGAALGVGGVMTGLVREAVGDFRADDAVRLEELTERTPLIPLAAALHFLPAAKLDAVERDEILQGRTIPIESAADSDPLLLLDPNGEALALAHFYGAGQALAAAPYCVFGTG